MVVINATVPEAPIAPDKVTALAVAKIVVLTQTSGTGEYAGDVVQLNTFSATENAPRNLTQSRPTLRNMSLTTAPQWMTWLINS